MKPTSSQYIVARKSRIHNKGVFAKKDIHEGTRVIEYVGKKVTKAEADIIGEKTIEEAKKNKNNGHVYLFELNKRHDIDGNVPWNTAKWINHSCDPNCETDIIKGHVWIIAIKDIKKREEITYDYGYDLDNYKDHPCRCDSKNCLGYIVSEDHKSKLKKLIKKNK